MKKKIINHVMPREILEIDGKTLTFEGLKITIPDGMSSSGYGSKANPNDEFNFDRVHAATLFVYSMTTKTGKNKNTRIGSYGLKHLVEKSELYNYLSNGMTYLANGELILAMMLNGFKTYPRDGINRYFNILTSDYNFIKKSIQ